MPIKKSLIAASILIASLSNHSNAGQWDGIWINPLAPTSYGMVRHNDSSMVVVSMANDPSLGNLIGIWMGGVGVIEGNTVTITVDNKYIYGVSKWTFTSPTTATTETIKCTSRLSQCSSGSTGNQRVKLF